MKTISIKYHLESSTDNLSYKSSVSALNLIASSNAD